MSLINQVLQDLDRRRASSGAIPASVRGVPALSRPRSLLRWAKPFLAAGTGAAVALAAALAWQAAQGRAAPPLGPATASAPTSAPADRSGTEIAARAELVALPVPVLADFSVASAALTSTAPVVLPASPALAEQWIAAPPSVERHDEPAEQLRSLAPPSALLPAAAAQDKARAPFLEALEPKAMRSLPTVAPIAPAEASVEKRVRPVSARERADTEYQRALGLHQQGQAKESEAAFASALQDDRRHAPARQALAVALVGQGRLDEAQRLLVAGLELEPQQVQLALILARVKVEQQDLSGAIDGLRTALSGAAGAAAGADHAQARALLATLQQRAGNHAEAIDNYGAALRQMPGNAAWWIGLAISLGAEGRAESSREAFERARSSETLTPELAQYVDQHLRRGTR